MRKAVILDGYTLNPGDLDWAPIENLANFEIYDRTTLSLEEAPLIIDRAKDAEVILTNKTPLNREILEQLPKLKYIGILATGINVVDMEAARELNITVTNIPSYGTETVAQAAFALLLELCHFTGEHSNSVKRGDWENQPDFCYWKHPIIELSGKTMGIIGYGRIGQVTSRIAQAFGMNVLAYNRTPEKVIETETIRYAPLEELYKKADVIMLHSPLTEENKGFINREAIEQMKDGVLIINNARGGLINESDLADALNRGKVGGAGVDVVSEEPIQADNPLLTAKNCVITPHISWASLEARQRLLNIAADNLKKYLEGQPVNVV